MVEIEVRSKDAAILTTEKRNGIEYVVSNDTIPLGEAEATARRLRCRIRYLPQGNDGSPIKFFNDGIG